MLRIVLEVPPERDRTALLKIADGVRTLIEDAAVATSARATTRPGAANSARALGDHPALGHYELVARGPTPGGAESEYGSELLLFEPLSGEALSAEAHGRLGLLVYAGSAGRDMCLRRTQGGVRLSPRAMEVLLQAIGNEPEVELQIAALRPAPWWAFWRRSRTPDALSKDPPRLTAPPYDEASIAAQLIRSAVRRTRAQRRDDDDDERWRDRDSSGSAPRDASPEYRGGGGSGGGGGASGGWSDAPAPGRGPGVNAAGMIVGAAGVAAVAAAAASAQRDQGARDTAGQPSSSTADLASGASAPDDAARASGGDSRSGDAGGVSSSGSPSDAGSTSHTTAGTTY